MNAKQAKKLCMPEVLSRMGYTPTHEKKGGNEVWYRSPLRNEKTPSFHTSYIAGDDIWVWKDFGDEGGNVLSFVMRHQNTNVSGALQYLRGLFPGRSFEHMPRGRTGKNATAQKSLFPSKEEGRAVTKKETADQLDQSVLEFVRAGPIKHKAIWQYLEDVRKIPRNLSDLYLKEVHFWNRQKKKGFFAFGMKNDAGGYEIRNASDHPVFKSALIQRHFTMIKGRAGDLSTISIFEGMLDYVSLLAMLGVRQLKGDALILHSTTTYDKAVDFLKGTSYETIHTFLDNNPTGQKYTRQFMKDFPDRVQNNSQSFVPYDDMNDALKDGFIPTFSLHQNRRQK